jgi:hypothetical protein
MLEGRHGGAAKLAMSILVRMTDVFMSPARNSTWFHLWSGGKLAFA